MSLYLNRKLKFYFYLIIVLMIVLVVNISFLSNEFEKYALKGSSHYTANREVLWVPSFEAAKIGGFIGIGYGTSANEIITKFKVVDSSGKIRREKGNSILALIEELGIIGLIFFFIPLFYVFVKSVQKQKQNVVLVLDISLLISLMLNSQFEDWMVSVTSFSLLLFLIFIYLTSQFLLNKEL